MPDDEHRGQDDEGPRAPRGDGPQRRRQLVDRPVPVEEPRDECGDDADDGGQRRLAAAAAGAQIGVQDQLERVAARRRRGVVDGRQPGAGGRPDEQPTGLVVGPGPFHDRLAADGGEDAGGGLPPERHARADDEQLGQGVRDVDARRHAGAPRRVGIDGSGDARRHAPGTATDAPPAQAADGPGHGRREQTAPWRRGPDAVRGRRVVEAEADRLDADGQIADQRADEPGDHRHGHEDDPRARPAAAPGGRVRPGPAHVPPSSATLPASISAVRGSR